MIYSNLYIALIAMVMCAQTIWTFSLIIPQSWWGFVFFSTLCSYCLHWALTSESDNRGERMQWTNRHRTWLWRIFYASALFDAVFLWHLKDYLFYLLPLIGISFLYTAPKIDAWPFRWLRGRAIGKTTVLSVMWIAVTVVTPLLLSGRNWTLDMSVYTFYRWLLVHLICTIFDYRDRLADRESGVLHLAAHLNEKTFIYLFYLGLMVYGISGAWWVTLAPAADRWVHGVLWALPGIFLAVTLRHSLQTRSDRWFYGVLDGLMAT